MPDNVSLPGAGSVIATKDNAGVEFQEMILVDNTFSTVNPATKELQLSIIDKLAGLGKIELVKADGVTAINPATSELQQSIIDKLPDPNASQKIADASGSTINPATSEDVSMKDILNALKTLIQVIANPPTTDKTANQIRAQVTGAVSCSGSLTSAGTVSTLSNIDIYPGGILMLGASRSAWASTVRNLIS